MAKNRDEFSNWIEKFRNRFISNHWSSRVERGLEYYRKGRIKKVFISPGMISSTVSGRKRRPYDITIKASTLDRARLSRGIQPLFKAAGTRRIESYGDLVGILQDGNTGYLGAIMPDVSTFTPSCSCPDYAAICKHVYAVFFGFLPLLQSRPDSALLFAGIDETTFRDIILETSLKNEKTGSPPAKHENSGSSVDLDSIAEDIRGGMDFFGTPTHSHLPSPVDPGKLKVPFLSSSNDIFTGSSEWISADLTRGYSIVAGKASAILKGINREDR